jgi:hypothetical protein
MYSWNPTLTAEFSVDRSSAHFSSYLVDRPEPVVFNVAVYTAGLSPEEVAETLIAGLSVSIARNGQDGTASFTASYEGETVAEVSGLHSWTEISPSGPVKGLAVVYGEPEEVEE